MGVAVLGVWRRALTSECDVLFVTLDSCRYDTFEAALAPNLKRIGPLIRAWSPSHFTFGAHAAFFMGFTPGDPSRREPFVNPKYGKIFKLLNGGHPGVGSAWVELVGRNIIDGFKGRGYVTLGTGAVGWFNPFTESGEVLTEDFDRFFYTGGSAALGRQRSWMLKEVDDARRLGLRIFAFLNVGETHVPYWHEGAPWSPKDNPCVPFNRGNDANLAREHQRICVEWVDHEIAPVLAMFEAAAIVVCSDHGDCWGEDGLWEHGIHHRYTLEVPLLYHLP